MGSGDIVIVMVMATTITAAAWWYFSTQKGSAAVPTNVGDCISTRDIAGNPMTCMKINCGGNIVTSCSKDLTCAEIRADAQKKCPSGGGGGGKLCVSDCACVRSKCPPGTNSCTACWMYAGTQTPCNPHAVPSAPISCAVNGGGGGGGQPCITDCSCAYSNCNGARSCTACWYRRGTNTLCHPSTPEIAAYGLSCPPGPRSSLAGYMSAYTQIKGTVPTGRPTGAAGKAPVSSYRPQVSQAYPNHFFKDAFR